VFDPKVQTLCVNPKFKCPNYGHSWACPPEAPYLENEVSKYHRFCLIFSKFDMNSYVKKQKIKHPRRSEINIRNRFYLKDYLRDDLEKEMFRFLETHKDEYESKLVLWDGHCRICGKLLGKGCTYNKGEPCRYPDKKRYSMEAVGINVTDTVKNLNLNIEWPPINHYYRFGLICFK
jgi:predicted metal-binding protein